MSGTVDEYGEPHDDTPDKGGTWSGPVSDDKNPGAQTAPAMDMHETTHDARIDGIIEQTRTDVDITNVDEVTLLLSRRLSDAGIDMTDAQVAELADRVANARDGA